MASQTVAPATSATTAHATMEATTRRPVGRCRAGTGTTASSNGAVCASSISSRASAASDSRRRRSFARLRRSNLRIDGDMLGDSASQSGACISTRAIVSLTSSPANARRPVSISQSTQPKAQRSARLSSAWSRSCSGLMYAGVPRTTPLRVPAVVTVVAAKDRLLRDRLRPPSPDRNRGL